MRKQDYLLHLITRLEPNEKRYFRLFSGLQPGEKRYMKLFEALENKQKYEANELCSELGIESWQLADDKHYLTQTLLQVLRNYDQESTELNILKSNQEHAQSLINRTVASGANLTDVVVLSLPADSSGQLWLRWQATNGSQFGCINAASIAAIPEPTAFVFLGASSLVLTRRRRAA